MSKLVHSVCLWWKKLNFHVFDFPIFRYSPQSAHSICSKPINAQGVTSDENTLSWFLRCVPMSWRGGRDEVEVQVWNQANLLIGFFFFFFFGTFEYKYVCSQISLIWFLILNFTSTSMCLWGHIFSSHSTNSRCAFYYVIFNTEGTKVLQKLR